MKSLKVLLLAAPLLVATALPGSAFADDNSSNYYDSSTNYDNSTNDNRYYDRSHDYYDNRVDDHSINAGGDAIVGNTTTNNTTVNKTVNAVGSPVQQFIN